MSARAQGQILPGPWPAGGGRLDGETLDQLLRPAARPDSWSGRPASPEAIEELHALVSLSPAGGEGAAGRFLFVVTEAGKTRLAPHVAPPGRQQVRAAPVCAIVGYDLTFAEHLLRQVPRARGAPDWCADPALVREAAARNGALQGAYLILAARAIGLEARPIAGFDPAGVSAAFFAGTRIQANFLCGLGYAPEAAVSRDPAH